MCQAIKEATQQVYAEFQEITYELQTYVNKIGYKNGKFLDKYVRHTTEALFVKVLTSIERKNCITQGDCINAAKPNLDSKGRPHNDYILGM